MTREAVELLRNDSVGADVMSVSWTDVGGWVAYEAVRCSGCDKWAVTRNDQTDEPHYEIDPASAALPDCTLSGCHGDQGPCEGCAESVGADGVGVCACEGAECDTVIDPTEGPMMNFLYPCPLRDLRVAARQVAHLPVCVVQFDHGETGFALTAGGMDLSWEICGAYVACGFLPPTSFSNLDPPYSHALVGWRLDVFQAMRRSIKCQRQWLDNATNNLDHVWEVCNRKDEDANATGEG